MMRGAPPPAARLTVAATVASAALTALVTATSVVASGIHSPSGHLLLNVFDASIGTLVAFLVYGKFLRSSRLRDLMLSMGLAMLVVAGLSSTFLARIVGDLPRGTLDVWLPLVVRMAGVLLITAAALSGERCTRSAAWRRWAWPAVVTVAVVACATLVSFRSSLPVAIELAEVRGDAEHPALIGHWVVPMAQVVSATCFLVAAALFTLQAARGHDPLLRWVGPACVLNAFARVNYLLFPSLYTDWLYTGDVLRTGAYVLLLVGAVREIQHFWLTQAEVAVLDDRRRLARELHDGVIQELTYIRSEAGVLTDSVPERARILVACDRALDEARAALHALGSHRDEPLSASLERAVRQVAERFHVRVRFDLDAGLVVTQEQRHALVRIAREAVTNAARHGSARSVQIQTHQQAEGAMLRVRDDGSGFDPADRSASGGYGVISMRDRARGLPGSFEIASSHGRGTTVTVRWNEKA